MINLGNEDVLKRHILSLKDIKSKKLRLRYVKPLTRGQTVSLFKQFSSFTKDKTNVNLFTEQVKFLTEHKTDSYDLFSSVTLPNYSTKDLLGLSLTYFHNGCIETTLLGVGEDIYNHNQHQLVIETIYLFYKLHIEPRSKSANGEVSESIIKEVFSDLLILMEEKAFWLRLVKEIELRLGRSPICYNLYHFIKAKSEREKEERYGHLKKMAMAKVKNLFIPSSIEFYLKEEGTVRDSMVEKESEVVRFSFEEIKKIKDVNPGITLLEKAMNQEFKYFTMAVWNRYVDLIRKYTAKKRTPPGELISLEELSDKGKELAEEEKEAPFLSKHEKPTIEFHKERLQPEFTKKEFKMLEFLYKNDLRNKTQPEITEAFEEETGIHLSESTMKRCWKSFREKQELLFKSFKQS